MLEHIWADERAIAEITRILRPGGSSPSPCRPGGPSGCAGRSTRVPRRARRPHPHLPSARAREEARARRPPRSRGSHHAHALHSPYWWLRCAVGVEHAEDAWAVKKYKQFLTWQIVDSPEWVDEVDRALNPVLGKSLVVYTEKVARCREHAARRARDRHRGRARRNRRRDRVDPTRRRQHPVVRRRSHRPVEPRRSRDGARHRRSSRRSRAPATTGWPACSATTARGTRTTSATTSKTSRSTPTSPVTSRPVRGITTSPPTTSVTCGEQWPMVEAAIDFALDHQRETGEIAWRGDDPADGALLTGSSSIHLSPEVRDRHRGAARSRASRLGAVARRARDRRRASTRRVPRQGPLGDGLVLPHPRWRAARLPRAGARRRPAGRSSWWKAAACAACPTARGSPPPRRASS